MKRCRNLFFEESNSKSQSVLTYHHILQFVIPALIEESIFGNTTEIKGASNETIKVIFFGS